MKHWEKLLLSIILVTNTGSATPYILDKTVAIVNDSVILKSDIDDTMRYADFNISQADQYILDDATLRHQIIEHLIMDQIILQISQKIGVKISNEELNQVIANIASQNKLTLNQMKSSIAQNGINYCTYLNHICKEMLIYKVISNEVHRRIIILPQEVEMLVKQDNYTNSDNAEINISYILIPLPENSTSDNFAEIEKKTCLIIKRARNSSDFNKLSIIDDIDQHKLQTGQIGWSLIRELPYIFFQALNTAKKGDIIGPIRSEFGFYIVKVNDLRNHNKNISNTKVHIRHILLKLSPAMTDYQARMKLEQIASDIRNGKKSFADAVREFSQDQNSINNGGDLGWVTTDIYDTSIRDVLMKLNKGQVSIPIKSSSGWHLIELLDTYNVDKTETEKKNQAFHILFNRKFSEEMVAWLHEQRANSYVKLLSD